MTGEPQAMPPYIALIDPLLRQHQETHGENQKECNYSKCATPLTAPVSPNQLFVQ